MSSRDTLPRRRAFLAALLAPLAARATPVDDDPTHARVTAGRTLRFPEDEGCHPEFRVEWWYVTGWLESGTRTVGFQVTFFRTAIAAAHANPSRFAPRQLLAAHAAVADPTIGKLITAQRAARVGFGLAEARSGKTDVWIDDWRLQQSGIEYACQVATEDFGLTLTMRRTSAPVLHGEGGYSRKGPHPESASHYYTHPQLAVAGRVTVRTAADQVHGIAWLDHEWSTNPMDANAVGWDWIGINLDDGGALMAFRMRGRTGSDHWAGATLSRAGTSQSYGPQSVRWRVLRQWRSPRTGTAYPVSFEIRVGDLTIVVTPLMDDQEQDARATAGTVYWEGAVRALRDGRGIGRGYLELTGYGQPLKL